MLDKVQIADPESVMTRYPHQLSGGMQQRVVIAMALACDPKLLILDEPTTGLDATVEAEVLDLVRSLRTEYGTSVLFISHNLGAIRSMCDRVGVLYAGTLVEEGPADEVFDEPRRIRTRSGCCAACPGMARARPPRRLETIPGFLPLLGADLPTCVFVDRCALADDRCRHEAPRVDHARRSVGALPSRRSRARHGARRAARGRAVDGRSRRSRRSSSCAVSARRSIRPARTSTR